MKHDPLERLAALARHAPNPAPCSLPFGFDTRIGALVSARPADRGSLWEFFAPRGVVAAALVCATAIAANHFTPRQSPESRMAAAFIEGALK